MADARTSYVIIDSTSGVYLRSATDDEIRAYRAGQTDPRGPAFDHVVRMGPITVAMIYTYADW